MDQNTRLFNVAVHLLRAAQLLNDYDLEFREVLLGKAKEIMKVVKPTSEEEIEKIERYKERIKTSL